jgi:exodeoxyribonuclease-1
MQPPKSFLWHDYETFGTDAAADRPAQFAALRTDPGLEIIGEPIDWFCALADDVLPHPEACLITGITPQETRRRGVCEAEFARRVHAEMMEPGTCSAGYNSLRFDDQFTRNLLYRNFYDPYEHQYAGGNSCWDLIDLVRMCYALRPEGIEWPRNQSGAPSFKLEDLSRANQLGHEKAHDALSDVHATIALARLIRQAQPRLFAWSLGLRDTQQVNRLLDPARPEPVLHTTRRFAATRGCTSLVLPLAVHPLYNKSVIVFDLMSDPAPLIAASAEQLRDRVFTPREDLPEDIERVPLKEIKTNRVPMLAPAATLKGVDCARIGLDPGICQERARMILPHLAAIRAKVMDVYAQPPAWAPDDPDLQIYSGGFFPDADRRQMTRIRSASPEQLARLELRFQDPRLPTMLFRYRARNYPETLDAAEAERWERWRLQKLLRPTDERLLGHAAFLQELRDAREMHRENGAAQVVLDQLQAWLRELGLPEHLETA